MNSSSRTDDEAERDAASRAGERLTVIIPCYNEESTVGATVESIFEVAATLPLAVHVLLIDDASTDDTQLRMVDLCQRYPRCRMVVNPRNLGIGRSVMNAYARIPPGTWVTGMPGDNELVFDCIRNFLAVRDRYDVILGYLQNPVIRPLRRRMASFAFNKIAKTLYGFPYRYLNGMKMYRVDAFAGLEVISGGHAYNAELLAKALLRNPGLRIGEAGFLARGRAHGFSKAIRPVSIVRAVYEVARGFRAVSRYRREVIRQQDDVQTRSSG